MSKELDINQIQKKLFFFLPLVVFIALAFFLLRAIGNGSSDLPSPLVGEKLPAFTLQNLEGETVRDGDFLGDAFLLNVWASWCPSCRVEHAYLQSLADKGVKIVGMNYKDNTEDALQFLEVLGDPFETIIVDQKGDLGLDLGVYGAPETYLVNAQGRILVKRIGVMNQSVWEEQFEGLWKQSTKGSQNE